MTTKLSAQNACEPGCASQRCRASVSVRCALAGLWARSSSRSSLVRGGVALVPLWLRSLSSAGASDQLRRGERLHWGGALRAGEIPHCGPWADHRGEEGRRGCTPTSIWRHNAVVLARRLPGSWPRSCTLLQRLHAQSILEHPCDRFSAEAKLVRSIQWGSNAARVDACLTSCQVGIQLLVVVAASLCAALLQHTTAMVAIFLDDDVLVQRVAAGRLRSAYPHRHLRLGGGCTGVVRPGWAAAGVDGKVHVFFESPLIKAYFN